MDPLAVLGAPPGDGAAAARAVMAAVESITPGPGGTLHTTYLGRDLKLTAQQAEQVRSAARAQLGRAVDRSARRGDDAMGRYQEHEKVNADFPVTSRAVKGWAWVRSLGDYSNPDEALAGLKATLATEADLARKALAAGQFQAAAEHVARADAASERAAKLVEAYVKQLIEGGEGLAVGLEYTRDAAFITLGILAVVVTGGAAAGVAPGVLGTGVAGLSVTGTATVISVGAPIVANVGAGAVEAAYGDKVDWGSIAFDAAVQVVLARFGGKLGQGVFGRLAGNPATATLGRKAVAVLLSGVATHEVSQAFSVTAHKTFDALRGRDVTWEGFVTEMEQRLTDPTGLFMAVLMSGVQMGANVTVERAAAPKPPTPPVTKPPVAKPPAAKPPAVKPPAKSPAAPLVATEPPAGSTSQSPTAKPRAPKPATMEPSGVAPPPAAKPKSAGTTKSTAAPKSAARPKAPVPAVDEPLNSPVPRKPGTSSRFAEGEGMLESVRAANTGASVEQRTLAERGTQVDSSPGRAPGRRVSSGGSARPKPAAASGPAAAKAPSPKPKNPSTASSTAPGPKTKGLTKPSQTAPKVTAKAGAKPISQRVLIGDLENGLPTGVTGELLPSDLHTGSPSSSDVNPVGLRTGELDPLGARRGHLLANLFGGSGRDRGNLAWMHKRINSSDYKVRFENPVRKALEGGNSVRFGVRPKFRPGEAAPYEVEVWATRPDGTVVVPVQDIPTPGLGDISSAVGD
ncbi:DNA/RNA non-specific endonuclease [Micromonospora sp. NPDC005299]|uniref:DNA/RNA non-specific endonuclease n=1 Tax=Micromonospora sp. NPDC005299 TaxID=3364231 RepID=UPI0036BD02D0